MKVDWIMRHGETAGVSFVKCDIRPLSLNKARI